MTLLALVSAALLAPMLGIALWNLAAAPRLERARPPRALPRVSVLVPARDEAANLRDTLPALLALDYEPLEVVVLDDHSTDGTADAVRALLGAGGRLRLLHGAPLPAGWLGKSWACHQLARAATGEVLVFCDADVRAAPGAVRATVGAMQAAGAGALTALPRHRLGGWTEHAVVPLVAQLPVLALLPLALVPRLRAPSLSMANGQWLACTRAAYSACGGHAAVCAEIVEDVALGRRVKAAGQRLLPVVATRLLEVRMYRGASEVRAGFGKNLYALVGGRPWSLAAALLVFVLTMVYPWAGAVVGARGTWLPLALLVAVRACGALLFRHGWATVLLHPAGSVLAVALALESAARARWGGVRWKGRAVGRVRDRVPAPGAQLERTRKGAASLGYRR